MAPIDIDKIYSIPIMEGDLVDFIIWMVDKKDSSRSNHHIILVFRIQISQNFPHNQQRRR